MTVPRISSEAAFDIRPLFLAHTAAGTRAKSNKFMKVNKDKILMVHLPDVFLKH